MGIYTNIIYENDNTSNIMPVEKSNTPTMVDNVEDLETGNNIEIIEPTDTLEQLEKEYNKWKLMTYKQRKVSNAKSLEVFGKNNIEHYEELKVKFVNKLNESISLEKDNKSVLSSIEYNKDKIEDAIKWCEDSNIVIIIPQNSLKDLETLWDKWKALHSSLKTKSNTKSIELFGINNEEHYNLLKSAFIKSGEILYNDVDKNDNASISSNINNIISNIEDEKRSLNPDILKIGSYAMKLDIQEPNTLEESVNKMRCIKDTNTWFHNRVCDFFDNIPNDLPYYTPEEIIDMDVYTPALPPQPDEVNADNIIAEKKWFESYILLSKGIFSEDLKDNTISWKRRLQELSFKLENNIEGVDDIKMEMYRLGWNPNIPFTDKNRKLVSENTKNKLFNSFKVDPIDISKFNVNDNIVLQVEENKVLYPVFIVLEYNDKIVAKLIRGFTGGKYTHVGISLDPSLRKIYTYNMRTRDGNSNNGFCIESIDEYRVDGDHPMVSVQCIFLKKKEYIKLRNNIEQFVANQKYTSYSFLTLLSILIKKEVQFDASMVCSQFVDFILKSVGIRIINKPSSLTYPSDFYTVNNKRVYKIYEGLATKYDKKKITRLLYSLTYKAKFINESLSAINESQYINTILENHNDINTLLYIDDKKDILSESNKLIYETFIKPFIDIEPIYEVKEFPVKFDEDGNLFIKRIKDMNFEEEYSKSHNLLKTYKDSNNLDGMKYELSKLWLINILLERKIYNNPKTSKE